MNTPHRAPATLWYPETEYHEGNLLWLVVDDHICGVVVLVDLYPENLPDYLPTDAPHGDLVLVRACEALRWPNGVVVWQAGEDVWTTWNGLRSRDEDLAVVEAYWIVNGVES